MRPGSLGRALGIGVRLATQRVVPPSSPATPPTPEQQRAGSDRRIRAGEALGKQARTGVRGAVQGAGGVARGGRNFGRAVWNPFAQAGSILWLEITGMFFALFALLFGQHLYSIRSAWQFGPEHGHFLAYAAFAGIFLYFAFSSFAKARRRSRSQ